MMTDTEIRAKALVSLLNIWAILKWNASSPSSNASHLTIPTGGNSGLQARRGVHRSHQPAGHGTRGATSPMTQDQLNQLGKTLWAIADDLRGAMNADDFRDYMLSFLFLRYLSDNYEVATKNELGPDYPLLARTTGARRWRSGTRATPPMWPSSKSRCAARYTISSTRTTSGAASTSGRALRTRSCCKPWSGASSTSKMNPSPPTSRALLRDQPQLGKAGPDARRPQQSSAPSLPRSPRASPGFPQLSTSSATPTNT